MIPRDVINKLALSDYKFVFGDKEILEHYSYSDTWIQYGTPQMKEALGNAVHYEVKTHYSRLNIYLHDERNVRDLLWDKLHEIAQWHGVREGESIVFRCPEKVSDLDDEAVFSIVTQGLHELYNAFNPFFNHLLFSANQNSIDKEELIRDYRIEDNLFSASDVIRRLVNADYSLNLGDGIIMQPNAKWKFQEGWTGWRYYKSYLDNDGIYFEIRTEGDEISVDVHDERSKHDILFRTLYREAVKNNLQIDVNDIGLWMNMKPRIQCRRPWNAIMSDIELQMKQLWNIFGALLEELSTKEVTKQSSLTLPPLAKLPHREYDSSTKLRKDINNDTLCWVMSVESLINRDPINLSSSRLYETLMRPGQYFIPSYQRRYAWTQDNVNQLCRDLLRAYNAHRSDYHLGTLIFHAPKTDNDENSFFVVDGQQRLRTISRLLSQEIFTENEDFLPERQFSDENEKTIWTVLQRFRDDKEKILNMLRKSTFVCIAVNDITESFQLFSTQNGRGKTLSPENLLKAYHFHEIQVAESQKSEDLDKIDEEWEQLNQKPTKVDGLLLHQVIGEHLYRIRCWLRGEFPREPFSSKMVNAFKGLTVSTIDGCQNTLPLGNLSVLRRTGDKNNYQLAHRSSTDKMNPFVFIDQPIVNGSDFFAYASTYCHAYETLFGSKEKHDADLSLFYTFYATYCLYPYSGRRGDVYARHIFQSLCLYCYDRFGANGLNRSYEYLYCCSYYERAVNARCYYQTCGREYAITAMQIMAGASSLSDLADRLCELYLQVCEQFAAQGAASVNGLECVLDAFSEDN